MTTMQAPGGPDAASASISLPRTERVDAPAYLQRYQQREAAGDKANNIDDREGSGPLYLRRFRDRQSGANALEQRVPEWEGTNLGVTRAAAVSVRSKEIVPESSTQDRTVVNQIHIIRHGETQGYSTESGLTPMGSWQSHRRGFDISKGVKPGEQVRIVCADTNRAKQTAEQIRKGLVDGLIMWGREADISEVTPMAEFRNFQVQTPEGLCDVTAAFRQYQKEMEKYERVALGERPQWLVEIDRFWRTQQGGGDPITFWTQIPMLNFEPPSATVRRFWAGFQNVAEAAPGARIICATHSGPIRVFAMWSHGYDPGEPYNTEEVLVRLLEGGNAAFVAYRNRVQEVHVPALGELPDWWQGLSGRALPTSLRDEEDA